MDGRADFMDDIMEDKGQDAKNHRTRGEKLKEDGLRLDQGSAFDRGKAALPPETVDDTERRAAL